LTPLHVMLKRLLRLPVKHRIAHIKSLLLVEKPYSQRRSELEDLLQAEILKQLRREIRGVA
jgi:hypothetical protein